MISTRKSRKSARSQRGFIMNPYAYATGGGGSGPMSLLLHGDGADASTDIVDSSSYGHSLTLSGAVQIDTAQSVFGGASILFDGDNDYLTTPANAVFQFGTGDFTIECRVRHAAIGGSGRPLFAFGSRVVYVSSTAFYYNNGSNVITAATQSTNTWYHIVLVRQSGTVRLYQDGVQVGSVTDSADLTSDTIVFGQFAGLQQLQGHMDEIRVLKGVCAYPNGTTFTVPNVAYQDQSIPTPGDVTFLENNQGTDGSTTFVDVTGGRTLTAIGNAQIDTAQFVFGDSSALFDGTGDGVSLDSNIVLLSTTKWSMEIWFRPRLASNTGGTASLRGLTVRANSGGQQRIEEVYYHDTGSDNRRIFGNLGGNKDVLFRAELNLNAGQWYYLLIQNDPGNSTCKTFLGNSPWAGLVEIDSRINKELGFGAYGYSVAASTDYMDGHIGPVRVCTGYDVPRVAPGDLFSEVGV